MGAENDGKDDDDDDEEGNTFNGKLHDMYNDIYNMRKDLERLRKPIGTKDNPARTCQDLFYGHPQFKGKTTVFSNYFDILLKFFVKNKYDLRNC